MKIEAENTDFKSVDNRVRFFISGYSGEGYISFRDDPHYCKSSFSVGLPVILARITVRGTTARDKGITKLTVGGIQKKMDWYSDREPPGEWTKKTAMGILPLGKHTLRIDHTGKKREESTDYWADLDYVEVSQVFLGELGISK